MQKPIGSAQIDECAEIRHILHNALYHIALMDAGEQFSLERVEAVLSRSHDAAHFIEQLKGALTEFCGTFDDDITAMAFDL